MSSKNAARFRVISFFCVFLTLFLCWRWQRIFYLMCADYIISDMPAHVRLALGHNDYSLASYIVRFLWALFGEARGQTVLSLILALNQLLGLFTLWVLIRQIFPTLSPLFSYAAVLAAHICGPWVFPGQTQLYLGAFNGNILHNMTMLFSRTPIPLVLLFFFRLWEARRQTLSVRDWLGFCVSLLLSTLFKPSFLGAFAPAVFVLLVVDFIQTRCRGVLNEFLIGFAVIPSLLVMLWSSVVLFSTDFAGTSSSMAIRPLTASLVFSLFIMYMRGLLLPIFAHLTQGRMEDQPLRARLSILWWVLGVAILEAVILTETGYRANDGNFEWGSLSLYTTVFAVAVSLLVRMLKRTAWKQRSDRIRALIGILLLIGHLVTGIYCLSVPGNAGYDWFYF